MSVLLINLAQRMTDLRRTARLMSTDAWWHLVRQTPRFTSVSSIVSIAAAIAASMLLPITVQKNIAGGQSRRARSPHDESRHAI